MTTTITQKDAREMISAIAKELKVSEDKIYKLCPKVKQIDVFSSPKARDLAKGLDIAKIQYTGDKITIDDVRKAMGEEPKAKVASMFASAQAKDLATKNELTQDSFEDEEKSGKERKNGDKTITLEDVKKKLGLIVKNIWSSPQIQALAEKHGLTEKSIDARSAGGKITKAIVEAAIKAAE
jgi:RecG-like helicase